MSDVKSVSMKGPATCGPANFQEPARPANDLGELLDWLFSRNGLLEKPASAAPKQAHVSASLKNRP